MWIDKRSRNIFFQQEAQYLVFKAIYRDERLPYEVRSSASERLWQLRRLGSISRLRNYCLLTGRSRGIIRKFRLSRIQFNDLCAQGALPGIRRGSW